MTEEEIRREIRSFLTQHIRNTNIEDGDDLFSSGLVNSMFAMELVSFVENKFKIVLANKDLNLDNFKTIGTITSLVQQNHHKVSAHSPGSEKSIIGD